MTTVPTLVYVILLGSMVVTAIAALWLARMIDTMHRRRRCVEALSHRLTVLIEQKERESAPLEFKDIGELPWDQLANELTSRHCGTLVISLQREGESVAVAVRTHKSLSRANAQSALEMAAASMTGGQA